jgi:hypothetical protein
VRLIRVPWIDRYPGVAEVGGFVSWEMLRLGDDAGYGGWRGRGRVDCW